MTSQNRQYVEDKYPEQKPEDMSLQEERMRNLFSNNEINWYKKSSEASDIIQEAGWKENIALSLVTSLVLILGGSTVKNAADKMQLKEEQVMAAMDDPYLMEQAKQIARTDNPQMTEPVQRNMPYDSKIQEYPSPSTTDIMENILTRTIYAETRNEPMEGKKSCCFSYL